MQITSFCLAILAQMYEQIPVSGLRRFQESAFCSLSWNAFYASRVTYLIQSGITRNINPNFVLHICQYLCCANKLKMRGRAIGVPFQPVNYAGLSAHCKYTKLFD